MRKIKILIFIFFLLFIPDRVSAFDSFTRNQNNPLPVEYVSPFNTNQQVHVYFEDNIFKAIFSTKQIGQTAHSLVYGNSSDGLNWKQEKIILTSPEDLSNPRVTRLNETSIKIYFTRLDNDGLYRQYSINCDNNFNCSDIVLVLQPSYYWENYGNFAAFPFSQNSTNYLFYGAWGPGGFRINLATQVNNTWEKCTTATLPSADGPFVFEENGVTYLFFHNSNDPHAINYVQTTEPISCTTHWSDRRPVLFSQESYDLRHLIFPSIVKKDNVHYLYYSGYAVDNIWRLNLATDHEIAQNKTPLIILPGFMGSWNKQAILHNETINQTDWILNPIVHEYDGLKQTLNNIGYVENSDYYFFYYDWRKGLNGLADDLNNFITTNNQLPVTNIQIVGHSLGGLVSRIYFQKHSPTNISKIITLGSPHQGTPQAYTAVEAGELNTENNLLWLAQKLILQINKNSLVTDKQLISDKFPIARDLLPIYNFLKNNNDQIINISDMVEMNNNLLSYQPTLPTTNTVLTTIVGETVSTISGYKIGARTIFDQLLNYYPDGRPTESFYEIGDETVISSSAKINSNPQILNLNHGELVYKKEGIKAILDTLSIPYQESQIVEGSRTQIFPSLIFLVFSPVTLKVNFLNNTYLENNGIIHIPNPQSGSYALEATGNTPGRYTILIGQLTENKNVWSKIEGKINSLPQVDSYSFEFNLNSPQEIETSSDIAGQFDELIIYLSDINLTLKKADINKSITNLQKAKEYFQQKSYGKLKPALQLTQNQILITINGISGENKAKLLSALEKLEKIYSISLQTYSFGVFPQRLKTDLTNLKKTVLSHQQYLLTNKNAGKNVFLNSLLLSQIDLKIKKAENSLNEKLYNSTEVLLKSASELLKNVRRL